MPRRQANDVVDEMEQACTLPERRRRGSIFNASKSEHTVVETGIHACGDPHRTGNLPSRVDEAGIPAFFNRS